ncbi:MAG: carE [Myxococcales bacterium]|nr:carE [Myxococcales bacterium]
MERSASRSSTSRSPTAARLDGLTGVRFVAAAWVFAYHFFVLTVAGAPSWLRDVQASGHAAVSLFFVLSGFVLAYNYAAPLEAGRVSRARFWWARFARVVPLYALLIVVEIPLSLHAGLGGARVAAATAADLAGLQAWIPPIVFVGNTPGWSVSVELFFYVAFPWLAARLFQTPRRALAELAAFVLAALATAALPSLLPAQSGWALFAKCGPLTRLPEFVVGIGLGRAFLRGQLRLSPRLATLLAIVAVGLMAVVIGVQSQLPRYFLHAVLLVPFALFLYAVAHGGVVGRALGWRPLTILGEVSYGLYLLQMPLFQAIGGKYEWSAMTLCGYFVLLVGCATVLHFAVERPAQRWLLSARS